MVSELTDIVNPMQRFFAYVKERDSIYQKKSKGEPWPWTDEPILQDYRFTEIYRERDRVSLHYQKTVREVYGESPITLPATVVYRWFNRPETCDVLFKGFPEEKNMSPFDDYITIPKKETLKNCINSIPPPHVTGAFIITGKPGFNKAHGVIEYIHDWMERHSDFITEWESWRIHPPSLDEMAKWLDGDGLGSFLRAQLVADLKYVPFLKNAPDWWTWASPGPGSMRGLNVVLGRDMNAPWNKKEWQKEIQQLNEVENIQFQGHPTITRFHCQDTQNHLCEFSKFTKVMFNLGRPRQVYRHV